MQKPVSIIEAVIEAANNGNVDAMVDRFAEDAVLRLDPEVPTMRPVYQGRLEIREYLQQIVANGFHVEASDYSVSNNAVSWRSTVSGGPFGKGRGRAVQVRTQAIVQANQILSMTIHYGTEGIQKLQAAVVEHA
ncbi:MAG TPA: nuclear transport factor 2 family protein [Anaerolineae bacterium]|nr:nuclear transport factor 2 family protein [Anaerolineae bacterium]HPL26437.1 nuclear transport factor 2 family protein [Anaerolineae bacterium]